MPKYTGRVQGYSAGIDVLIDTGASHSFISEGIAAKIPHAIKPSTLHLKVTLPDGSTVHVDKEITVPFRI